MRILFVLVIKINDSLNGFFFEKRDFSSRFLLQYSLAQQYMNVIYQFIVFPFVFKMVFSFFVHFEQTIQCPILFSIFFLFTQCRFFSLLACLLFVSIFFLNFSLLECEIYLVKSFSMFFLNCFHSHFSLVIIHAGSGNWPCPNSWGQCPCRSGCWS